jgi:hypothetical protein
VPGSADWQCLLSLTMPDREAPLSVLVRFAQEQEELYTLELILDVVKDA